MDKTQEESYKRHFQKEKERTSYMKFYDTLSDAISAMRQIDDAVMPSIWRTPEMKYAIVMLRDRQVAADFGYGEVLYAGNGENPEINPTCDGSKSYVYKMYKELGLL